MAEHEKTVDLPAHEASQATHRGRLVDIHVTDLPAVKTVVDAITAAGPTNAQMDTAIALCAQIADGWDAALATILDNFSAGRIGNLDQLDFALQEAIAAVQAAMGLGTCADTTDPVDMSAEIADDSVEANKLTIEGDTSDYDRRTDSQEAISDAVAEVKARQLIAHQVYCTENEYALKDANLDVFLADAIAGTIYDLVFEVYLELDAAATYAITISKTDALNPTTFTAQLIPAIAPIATPAAAGRYRYEAGDLAQGDQCKFNIAQDNAGDAAHDIVAVMTCKL